VKTSFQKLTSLLQQAVFDHYFSGASLLLFYEGDILFQEEVGETAWKIEGVAPEAVRRDTLFDLASLTKPLVTVFLTALLCQEKKISLQARVGELLDQPLSEEIRDTPLRALLNHSSGFPDWKPYFSELFPEGNKSAHLSGEEGKRSVYQKIHREPFVYSPGEKSLYSDLGFILLGEILEERSDQNLDQLFDRKIVAPLGIKDLGFIPLDPFAGATKASPFGKKRAFMATEKSDFRKEMIQGVVHDDNAYVMGGVAGHAGLFGTAQSLYPLFLEWRNGYWNKGALLAPSTVEAFVERERFSSDWGLGWMFPSVSSSAGSHFSKRSFGHLGFTGTSIWYDPEVDLGVIFLSNRIHPTRENHHLKGFRPALHNLIYQTVIDEKS
jgi:CubicO group peptidase (beta-lactamase class C family)